MCHQNHRLPLSGNSDLKMNQVGEKAPSLSYRPEVDGLRAVAVISVILYHAQLVLFGSDWFKGGYIGVDIFFVISGYLITRIILAELNENATFSFSKFYERRARRILPMLFVVIVASIPFAWQKLLPSDFVEYAESILASIFFGSNFFFYFNTTEYGADSALLKPFLHTWSLGVEEQFYFFFPVLALVSYKYFRNYFLSVLIGLSLLSLQFAEVMEVRNSDLNFYLPFSRFWELSVGALLAVRELSNKRLRDDFWSKLLPMVGFYLVIYSILFFSGDTPHPSFHTLIPILGVALIIGYASQDELVGRVLGSKPFVWVGLISYSAYLWHFPIFAFSRNSSSELSNYDKYEWIALTFVLSVVSYFAIERPFRNRKLISSRLGWTLLALVSVFTIAFMSYAVYSEGFWDRYSKGQQEIIKGFNEREFKAFLHPTGEKGLLLNANEQSVECYLRDPAEACRYGDEKFVFLGDSYVSHYERAVFSRLDELGVGFISLSYGLCPFVAETMWFGGRAECSYVNEQRKKIIEGYTDKKIFLVSANVLLFENAKKRTASPIEDGRANVKNAPRINSRSVWDSYFENIRWLEAQGHKVILVRTLPMTQLNAIAWLGNNKQYLYDMSFPNIYNNSKPSAIRARDAARYANLRVSNNIKILDPVDVLCDATKDRCYDVKEGLGPIFNGGRHLSYVGADLMADEILKSFIDFES